MLFSDVPIGVRVTVVEPMDDGFDCHEVRRTDYEPREGIAVFSPKYRCAWRLRTVQGDEGETPRFDTREYRVATELPLRLPVTLALTARRRDDTQKETT